MVLVGVGLFAVGCRHRPDDPNPAAQSPAVNAPASPVEPVREADMNRPAAAHERIVAPADLVNARRPEPQAPFQPSLSPEQAAALEARWGISDCTMMLSAAGYMLDFRYRLVDPNKAAPLFDERNKPHLEHPRTGAKLIVPTPPKVGALRQKPEAPVVGKTYFMIFANPGRLVRAGETVSVIVGEFKAEDLVVH